MDFTDLAFFESTAEHGRKVSGARAENDLQNLINITTHTHTHTKREMI